MIKLPEIFQDGMVLQQNKPIKIWGNTEPNTILQIQLGNNTPQIAGVQEDGKFSITLPAQSASDHQKLAFFIDNKIEYSLDVKIGEVWLLAGQSNMDFNLRYDKDYQENKAKVLSMTDHLGNLNVYKVPQKILPSDQPEKGTWKKLNSQNSEIFSAIGYYFGIKLAKFQNKVPVGLVWMTYGGTTASTWVSEKALMSDPVLKKAYIDTYRHIMATRPAGEYDGFLEMVKAQSENPANAPFWDNVMAGKVSHEELSRAYLNHHELFVDYVIGPQSENRPHGLFDTMVSEIIGYSIKGCLWYQGESDDEQAGIYDHLLTALIKDWWNRWNDHFPFLIMQVAPFKDWFGKFDGTFYPEIRMKQSEVSSKLPSVYITNVMDNGMKYDIHPKNKSLAAERFYDLAMSKVYKTMVNGEAPKVIETKAYDQQVEVKFNNCNELVQGENLQSVLKVKVNGINVEVDNFKLDKNILKFDLPKSLQKSQYLEIDYQQQEFSHAQLFNENNIPVRPFIEYTAD